MLSNKKILPIVVILLVIIIIGCIQACTKGLNYGLSYGENVAIEMNITTEFELKEIEKITSEVLGSNEIKNINNIKGDLLITAKSASEEQLNNLVNKINEKYELELKTEDLNVTDNAKVNLIDLVFPYIAPVIIATTIITVYFAIKYRKIGIFKTIFYTLGAVMGIQLLLLSIYSLLRLPINELTMPISMLLFILTFMLLIEIFDRVRKECIKEQQ